MAMRAKLESLAAGVEQTRADFLRTELMMGMTCFRVAVSRACLGDPAAADALRQARKAYDVAARQLPLLGAAKGLPLEEKLQELGQQLGVPPA
jgi:hypothetical protein